MHAFWRETINAHHFLQLSTSKSSGPEWTLCLNIFSPIIYHLACKVSLHLWPDRMWSTASTCSKKIRRRIQFWPNCEKTRRSKPMLPTSSGRSLTTKNASNDRLARRAHISKAFQPKTWRLCNTNITSLFSCSDTNKPSYLLQPGQKDSAGLVAINDWYSEVVSHGETKLRRGIRVRSDHWREKILISLN